MDYGLEDVGIEDTLRIWSDEIMVKLREGKDSLGDDISEDMAKES